MNKKIGGYMKKLLLLLTLCATSLLGMQQPKRKRVESPAPPVITYSNQTAIAPWRIVAFDKNIKAGFIDIDTDPIDLNFGHIKYLQVNEGYRGVGIGYELFKRAIFALKKKGFEVIIWDATDVSNVNIENLEKIYLNYILKLKDELEFDFIMDERFGDLDLALTPMKIIIKNKGIYPEVI
jgi:ribosomal protein S18 acetylase RimI-like enzyme